MDYENSADLDNDNKSSVLGPGSSTGGNDERNQFGKVKYRENGLFAVCTRGGFEEHLIMAGIGGAARWGKAISSPNEKNPDEEDYGLGSNCLVINLNQLETVFHQVFEMKKQIAYLKSSKQLVTDPYDPEGHSYRTFSMEKNPMFRLTGLIFNDARVGMVRYFNPYLSNKGKGVNELIMAKHSLITFPDIGKIII